MSRNYITQGHFKEINRQLEDTIESLLAIFPRKKDYQISEEDLRMMANCYKKLNIWTAFIRDEYHESYFACLESILENLATVLHRQGISVSNDD